MSEQSLSENSLSDLSPMEQIQNALESVIGHGASIAEVLDIEADDLENAYKLAHEYYSSKAYEKALGLFHQLALLNHLDSRFTMGMAACFQQLQDFENAIDFYNLSGYSSQLEDPTPFYYAGICNLKIGEIDEALVSLEVATITGEEDTYLDIRKKAKTLFDNLSAQVEAESKQSIAEGE